jgi:hypothetical protein
MNMTFGQLLSDMKANLTPFNPEMADIVKMGIHSNYGYMEGKTVRAAIDCFQERSRTAYALGEKLNPLEQLGAMLLLESAHLNDL